MMVTARVADSGVAPLSAPQAKKILSQNSHFTAKLSDFELEPVIVRSNFGANRPPTSPYLVPPT